MADELPSPELVHELEADAGRGGTVRESDLPRADGKDELSDPLDGIAFGPTILEKLLAGIIAAHPHGKDSNATRLNKAMWALVGHGASGNAPVDDRDDRALLLMATEAARRANAGEAYNDSDLARFAAKRIFPNFDPETGAVIVRRLAEKYGDTYTRKIARRSRNAEPSSVANTKRTMLYRVREHDHVVESVEAQILARMQRELSIAGVPMALPN